MPPRGRVTRVVEYDEDDDESLYETIPVIREPQPRSRSRVGVSFTEDHVQPSARRAERQKVYHHNSYQVPHTAVEPDNIFIENNLNVPQQYRPRASSQGAAPQPNFLPIFIPQQAREPSRERLKDYRHQRHYSDESDDDSSYRSSSRHRRGRKSSSRNEYMDPEIAKKLAKLELLESQRNVNSHLNEYESRLKAEHRQVDPLIAEKLARLKALEDSRAREEEEAAIIARMENRKKKDKQREESLLLEYQEQRRKEEDAEREAFAKAEARRQKKEAEQKTERERLIFLEKEKSAKLKAERQRIIAEEREEEARAKKEAEEERRKILLEEELRRKKAKDEHEQLRRKILAEEDERIEKEKTKKKKEEEEFNQKVKERFMKAGYSPGYIEDILDQKNKGLTRQTSHRTSENRLAIDISRPTYIRVHLKYLYPETLDHYRLPWQYDPQDDKYVLIKEYISHELQQELFDHTKKLKLRGKEQLLITDGYTKDTITTLKPRDVFKDKDTDDMFIVRRKSATSKSPARRSWMFT